MILLWIKITHIHTPISAIISEIAETIAFFCHLWEKFPYLIYEHIPVCQHTLACLSQKLPALYMLMLKNYCFQVKKRTSYSPVEVTYEYYDRLDIKAGRENPGVRAVTPESTEVRTRPTSIVEALSPEATTEPTTAIREEQPRWVITENWTPCSRSCGKGTCTIS